MNKGLPVLALLVLVCINAAADMWYVDVDNTARPWDGTSWATAFQTIQEGIDTPLRGAEEKGIREIRRGKRFRFSCTGFPVPCAGGVLQSTVSPCR